MKNKVLIITNPLNHEGGVVNYYNLFFKHFKSEEFALKHLSVGSRAYLFYYPLWKRLLYPFYYIMDIIIIVLLLCFDRKIKIIQVSPSLIPVPLIRDGILVLIGKLFRKKVIVFYRGWKIPTLKRIESSKTIRKAFNLVFQSKTTQIVLAKEFKTNLISLDNSSENKIHVTHTAINKEKIILPIPNKNEYLRVLFLGRIQDLKGINEIISSIIEIKNNGNLEDYRFSIVGHENKTGYIDSLKTRLEKAGVSSNFVSFPGRIVGKEKFELYAKNDIYLLPSYTEGCPNSVLEALASGLYCITTPVGALYDIIEPGKNGMLISPKSISELVASLNHCSLNKELYKTKIERAQFFSEKFDIRTIVYNFNKLYNETTQTK